MGRERGRCGGGLRGRRGMSLLIGWREGIVYLDVVDGGEQAEMVLASAA